MRSKPQDVSSTEVHRLNPLLRFRRKQKACAPGSLVHTSALSSDNIIISDVHIVLRRWNVTSFQNNGCIACDKINSYVRESYEGRARIYADE